MLISSDINSKIFLDNKQNPSFPSSLAIKIGLEIFKNLELLDRKQARLVCRKWKQLIDKIDIIENYNISLKSPADVRQEATHYLRNPEKLKAEQRFLLTIVRLSKDCIKIKVAAANALMILKKTNFSFIGCDLKGIQAPGVRLARAILNKANFSGANLEGADFTGCSLENAILDGAELRDVQFGQLPYLNHQSNILAMAVSPDGKHLASVDWDSFYIWNLETFEAQTQILATRVNPKSTFPKYNFLQFFQNGQFLFRASCMEKDKLLRKRDGKIEIWKTNPLKMINSLLIENIEFFSLLALTQDEKMLITLGIKDLFSPMPKIEICLWQINFNTLHTPQLQPNPVKKKIIMGFSVIASRYAPKNSIIAILVLEHASECLRGECVKFYTLPDLEEVKQGLVFQLSEKKKISPGNIMFYDMIFTPQESHFVIINRAIAGENKSEVHSWNIKNKQKKILFFEEGTITHLHFLSDNSQMAYFTSGRHGIVFFRIRDKDCKLKFSERLSLKNSDDRESFKDTLNFISNDQFVFQSKIKQISIASLKAFVGKKEFPLSLRDMYFSPDEQKVFLWSYEHQETYLSNPENTYILHNVENKLYTYQTFNGKKFRNKKLPKPFSAPRWFEDWGCRLSSNAQYYIRTCPSESNGKNKITISQVENEKVQASYTGSFLSYSLSKDNRYLVFIYQNQFKLIEIDFEKHNQLVDMDSTKQKLTVSLPCLLGKEKIKYTLSDHVFPVTTLALSNIETGQISIWEINWEAKQVQEVFQYLTKLFSTEFCLYSQSGFYSQQSNFYFQQSKFYFQENEQALIVWDKKTHVKQTIKTKNQFIDFIPSQNGDWIVTIEKIVISMDKEKFPIYKSRFCLVDLDQRKRLDHFTLPFGDSIMRLSPNNKFLIVNHKSDFEELSIWKIKEGKFQLLWKFPHYLNVKGLSLKNTQNLDVKNALLLYELKKSVFS
ncbi:pentapeptide repeat-containing protein [Candidatus Protochlamydia sp. W-9]|uniref:pentapeptide repeat-containing protein n=1 Tax=Candidatus Protochlamydia sp. W-9 TaxID=1785087 RepID=UPI00096A4AD7|nr:pentapeptide repeat-containing protein [Candidatus Protochlamydia sp. W-9]